MAAAPTPSLGVIAEDDTDFEVIQVLAGRISGNIRVRRRVAQGGSNIRRKAAVWMRQLAEEGCRRLVILHDLDRNPANNALNDEARLRQVLTAIPVPPGVQRVVCIPVEEIEAWFWSDPVTVREVGRGSGVASPSPHLIRKPKEALVRLSQTAGGKPRYSTNVNPDLAKMLDLDLCARRCPSFQMLRSFLAA
jgi:hypothetical protein